jgi:hypothetical protein
MDVRQFSGWYLLTTSTSTFTVVEYPLVRQTLMNPLDKMACSACDLGSAEYVAELPRYQYSMPVTSGPKVKSQKMCCTMC